MQVTPTMDLQRLAALMFGGTSRRDAYEMLLLLRQRGYADTAQVGSREWRELSERAVELADDRQDDLRADARDEEADEA